MKQFLTDSLVSIALGALLFLAPESCESDTVPSPVSAPESAAASGCAESDFQCCQTWVETPTCKDGQLTCREGWVTCGQESPEGGSP